MLRPFYQPLRASCKPAKVALVATMPKLLLILNAMLKTSAIRSLLSDNHLTNLSGWSVRSTGSRSAGPNSHFHFDWSSGDEQCVTHQCFEIALLKQAALADAAFAHMRVGRLDNAKEAFRTETTLFVNRFRKYERTARTDAYGESPRGGPNGAGTDSTWVGITKTTTT